MEWKTRITEMLGCRYPILVGAFNGFGTSAIAAPVSTAGGFGIITAQACKTPAGLRDDIRRCRSLTDRPFGVNLSLTLCPDVEGMLEVAIAERVAAIETAVYRADHLGRRIQEAGIIWIHKAASITHAIACDQLQGPDILGIVGVDGAGHKAPFQLPTMINIPIIRKQTKLPLLASGGIADGRGFLAALAMGADGVILGTVFMATKECPIPPRLKQRIVEGDPSEESYWRRAFAPPSEEENERIRRGALTAQRGPRLGRVAPGSVMGGSLAVGLIHRVRTCQEVINDIIAEAEAIVGSDEPLWQVARSAVGA